MKMLATAGAIALIGAVAVMHAAGADGPDRPPGVRMSEWAPISDTVGIVLVPQTFGVGEPTEAGRPGTQRVPILGGNGAALSPPTNGYFMVKRAGHWIRLVMVEPFKGPGDAG
jgi:hypothetical protein